MVNYASMPSAPQPPTHLFVDRVVADWAETRRIVERTGLTPKLVGKPDGVHAMLREAADPEGTGKRVLHLTRNKGAFLKPCPGTRHYACCGYRILHFAGYCVMDCSYCILQSYFHPPVLQYFVNTDAMRAELDSFFRSRATARIGTGEFTDSLIWEAWTGIGGRLARRFAPQSRAVLELKTKTAAVDSLAGIDHNRKTIVAWSLNTETVIASQERGTAGLSQRLAAAARCAAWGYPLAFHFDPMILYDGCEQEYRRVIERLFAAVSPRDVVWISLGTLRFMPSLKAIVQRRFPHSDIVYGELVPGLDGKMRYFKPLRMALYRRVVEWIRQAAGDVCIYFCMEDDEVWQDAMGFRPADQGGLGRMLDRSAAEHCGLT